MKIYLIRHGQTTGDVENRFGGDYDDNLTSLGRAQVYYLAQELADMQQIELIFSSPKLRALQTAAIVSKTLGLTARTLEDFRERNSYGILTGMTRQEANKQYPDQVALLQDTHNTVSGAEPYQVFKQRITSALDNLTKLNANQVAVVTHGGPISLVFREILGMGELEKIEDCAYIILETSPQSKIKLVTQKGIHLQSQKTADKAK